MRIRTLVASLALACASISIAMAQSIPGLTEGKDYNVIKVDAANALVPAPAAKDKPTLIEFFWYGCPHCYDMEPMVKKFLAEHKEVVYKRYPVVTTNWQSGARLYFTMEQMGIVDKLHDKVFSTLHVQKINIMDDQKARDAFLTKEGVDASKFESIYNSFSMASTLTRANKYLITYKVDSTPTFVVNNAYSTSPGITGSYDNTMKSLETIVKTVEK